MRDKPPPAMKPNPASRPVQEVLLFTHGKIHEVEHENVGVEGGHKGEELAERQAGRAVRGAIRYYRLKPYQELSKAERQAEKANIEYFYQKALHDNPQLAQAASNPISRFWQKRQIKRQYVKAARAAGRTAAHGAGAAKGTAKAAKTSGKAAKEAAKEGPPAERNSVRHIWLPDGICKPLSLHRKKSNRWAVEFEPTRSIFPALDLCATPPVPALRGHLGAASGRPTDGGSYFDFRNQDQSCFECGNT